MVEIGDWQIWFVFVVIFAALVSFAIGRWPYDLTGLAGLLALTLAGIITPEEALAGFSHTAVITVAAVLVIGEALQVSRAIDVITNMLARFGERSWLRIPSLIGIVTGTSAFMNDTGALAAMMPAAIGSARQLNVPPSRLLMPIAYAALLGGMITAIGTPANIIIAALRVEAGSPPFALFDFAYVGLPVAAAGAFFLGLIGWRWLPRRQGSADQTDLFDIRDYLTEVRVTPSSSLANRPLAYLGQLVKSEVTAVALIRGDEIRPLPRPFHVLQPGDLLVVKADPNSLSLLIEKAGVALAPKKDLDRGLRSGDVTVMEAVVRPGSLMIGRNVRDLNLRWRHGLNLLAVSHFGANPATRVSSIRFQPGDILLLQGGTDDLREACQQLDLLPLPERPLRLGMPTPAALTLLIFGGAIAATIAGLVPFVIAFTLAAFLMVAVKVLSPGRAYKAIDWPVIVLLASMLPYGTALERSGGAALLGQALTTFALGQPGWALVAILMLATVALTNLIGAKPAAVLAGAVALHTASLLGVSADPLLMTVAIAASCAFLTPIGHQVNVIVMGPGGYRFTDYLRLGLPLTLLVTLVTVPLILRVWPL